MQKSKAIPVFEYFLSCPWIAICSDARIRIPMISFESVMIPVDSTARVRIQIISIARVNIPIEYGTNIHNMPQ